MIRKLPRVENVADMLTHPPSASELERFVPMCGMKNEILEKYRDMTSKMRAGFKAVSKMVAGICCISSFGHAGAASLPENGLVVFEDPALVTSEWTYFELMRFIILIMITLSLMLRGFIAVMKDLKEFLYRSSVRVMSPVRVQHDVACQTVASVFLSWPEVMVTRSGDRYHNSSCGHLRRSVGLRSLTACEDCKREMRQSVAG